MKYWKHVAEMLGVELNQEFHLTTDNLHLVHINEFRLTENGLQIKKDGKWEHSSKLYWILNGDLVVHSDFEKLREDIEKDMRGE
jgi:hypothetical protein|nr:MAG TPA: hypothetical protein [Caudoviricetes sp.]